MNLSYSWIGTAVISGFLQLASITAFFILWLRTRTLFNALFSGVSGILLNLALCTLVLKMVLEIGSAIPVLESLVFSTRSIVIGYLHLVLLGFVSCLLLAIAIHMQWLSAGGKWNKVGIGVFIGGFIGNEFILFVDGLLNYLYRVGFPFSTISLFTASLLLLLGVACLGWSGLKRRTKT